MWTTPLALIALALRAVTASLTPEDANAAFSLIGAEGVGCARTLQHVATIDKNQMSFSSVQIGSTKCASAPDVMTGSKVAVSAGTYVTGGSIARAATDTEHSLLAVDNKPRKCGDTSYAKGTVTAIVRPQQYLTVAPGLQVPPGLWAVIANPSKSGLCLYSGKETAKAFARDGLSNATIPTRSDDSVCFPGNAHVLLADGTYITMDQLDVGDMVATGEQPSRVYMFTHRDRTVQYRFVRLHTRLPRPLVLTAGHRIYANGALVAADELRVGDSLRAFDGQPLRVHKIDSVFGNGLFNPQTVQGDIIVDGVIVSTFTSTVETRTAHALLAPLRAFYTCTRNSFSTLEGNTPFSRWIRSFRRRS